MSFSLTPYNGSDGLILSPAAWSKGNGTSNQNSGNFPRYPAGASISLTGFTGGTQPRGYVFGSAGNGSIEWSPDSGAVSVDSDMSFSTFSNMYFSCWIKYHVGTDPNQMFFDAFQDPTRSFYVYVIGSGDHSISCNMQNNGKMITNNKLVEGGIYHMAFTYQSGVLRCFLTPIGSTYIVECTYAAKSNFTGSPTTIDPGYTVFGYNNQSNVQNITFNRQVMTDAQIQAEFSAGINMGLIGNNTGDTMSFTSIPTSNTLDLTPYNQIGGIVLAFNSWSQHKGNGKSNVNTGNMPTTDGIGVPFVNFTGGSQPRGYVYGADGQGLCEYNDTNSYFYPLSTSLSLTSANNYSCHIWLKFKYNGAGQNLWLDSQDGSHTASLHFSGGGAGNNWLCFGVNGTDYIVSTFSPADGQKYLISFQKIGIFFHTYVNSIETGYSTHTAWSGTVTIASNNFSLGYQFTGEIYSALFAPQSLTQGQIDDVWAKGPSLGYYGVNSGNTMILADRFSTIKTALPPLDLTPFNQTGGLILPFASWGFGNGNANVNTGNMPNPRGQTVTFLRYSTANTGYVQNASGLARLEGNPQNGNFPVLQPLGDVNMSLTPTNNYYCDFWIQYKTNGNGQSPSQYFWVHDAGGSAQIFVWVAGGGTGTNYIACNINTVGYVITQQSLYDNGLYHVAFQKIGSAFHVYIDRVECTYYTNTAWSGTTTITPGNTYFNLSSISRIFCASFAPQSMTQAQIDAIYDAGPTMGYSGTNSGNTMTMTALSAVSLTPFSGANSVVFPWRSWSKINGVSNYYQTNDVMPNYPNGSTGETFSSFTAGQAYQPNSRRGVCEWYPNGGYIIVDIDFSIPINTKVYSIIAWFTYHDNGNSQQILDAFYDASHSNYVYSSGGGGTNGQIACNIQNNGYYAGAERMVNGATYMIVFQKLSTGFFQAYLNAQICTPYINNQWTSSPLIIPTGAISIGYQVISTMAFWAYNEYAFSQSEINALYAAGPTLGYKSYSLVNQMYFTDPPVVSLAPWNQSNGLILAWRAWSEGDGLTNKYTGNMPRYPAGTSVVFNGFTAGNGFVPNNTDGFSRGLSSGYYTVSLDLSVTNTNQYFMDVWFQYITVGYEQDFWRNDDGAGHNNIWYLDGSGRIYYMVNNTNYLISTPTLTSGKFYHLSLTKDSGGHFHIYINSVEISYNTNIQYTAGVNTLNPANTSFGYLLYGPVYKASFAPQIMTQNDIDNIYSEGPDMGYVGTNSGTDTMTLTGITPPVTSSIFRNRMGNRLRYLI